MPELDKIYLFRMTHIDNIAHIYQYGITHKDSPYSNPMYKPIGDSGLISRRDVKRLSNGHKLGDYIPFYFCIRSPMLYVLTKRNLVKQEDIVYCVTSVAKISLLNLPFLFTDGHAFENISKFYEIGDLQNIFNLVDFRAVKASRWSDETQDTDIKRRKQAEFLVLGDIAANAIVAFVVYNNMAKQRLLALGIPAQQIYIGDHNYYY